MKKKRIIYFVTLSTNASIVLRQAVDQSSDHEVMIFFDLDGSRILDKRYLEQNRHKETMNVEHLIKSALLAGVRLYGCQMNVMYAAGMQCMDGVELAGVATFLDLAYDADAVLSY